MIQKFVGYHGTNASNVISIKKNNFTLSQNDDEWLGFGVYFFIDGIGCPKVNAVEWANNQAYCTEKRRLTYTKYSVLSAPIACKNVLDASKLSGINAFNAVRDYALKSVPDFNKRFRSKFNDNRIMWNFVSEQMELDAVINSLYIKNKQQRIKGIISNVPNSMVLCVRNNKHIDFNNIDVLYDNEVVK